MKSRWQFDLRSLMVFTFKIAVLAALFRYGTLLPYQAKAKRKQNVTAAGNLPTSLRVPARQTRPKVTPGSVAPETLSR